MKNLNVEYKEVNNNEKMEGQIEMGDTIGSTEISLDYSGDEKANLVFEYWRDGKFVSELFIGRDIKLSDVNKLILGVNPMSDGSSEVIGQVTTVEGHTVYKQRCHLDANDYMVSYESINNEINEIDISQDNEIFLWAINKGSTQEFKSGDSIIESAEQSEWSVVVRLDILSIEKQEAMYYNELIESLDQINTKLSLLESRIDDIENNVLELDGDLENDISNLKKANRDVKEDIAFIEDLIWRGNLFEFDKVNVGDYVGQMKVSEINEGDPIVYFTGEVMVKGSYGVVIDSPVLADGVYFYVDDATGYLPRERSDNRVLWFMITNTETAYEMLENYSTTDEILIIIDEYVVDLTETATVNTAKLVKVISN